MSESEAARRPSPRPGCVRSDAPDGCCALRSAPARPSRSPGFARAQVFPAGPSLASPSEPKEGLSRYRPGIGQILTYVKTSAFACFHTAFCCHTAVQRVVLHAADPPLGTPKHGLNTPVRLGRDRTRNPVDEDAHGHGIWSGTYVRTSLCPAAPDSEKEYTPVQYLVNPRRR